MFTSSVQIFDMDGNGFSIFQIVCSLGYDNTKDNMYILFATDESADCIWLSGW